MIYEHNIKVNYIAENIMIENHFRKFPLAVCLCRCYTYIITFYFKINFLSPLLTLEVRCRSAVIILSVGYTIADTL